MRITDRLFYHRSYSNNGEAFFDKIFRRFNENVYITVTHIIIIPIIMRDDMIKLGGVSCKNTNKLLFIKGHIHLTKEISAFFDFIRREVKRGLGIVKFIIFVRIQG